MNVFQKEQELYAQEGIKAKKLEWVSNQHVIDLVEKKPKGIFPLLDNQWKVSVFFNLCFSPYHQIFYTVKSYIYSLLHELFFFFSTFF